MQPQKLDNEFYAELRSNLHVQKAIKLLSSKSVTRSLLSVGLNWVVVFLACALVCSYAWLFPIALIMVGSRQRGFSNLVHDAAHGNLSKNKTINDFIADFVCSTPMFETTRFYKTSHLNHHRYLGDNDKDPDSKSHLRYGYDDNAGIKGSSQLLIQIIFNKAALQDSVIGSLLKLKLSDILKVLLWWTCFLLVLSHFSLNFLNVFLVVWFLSKLTTYHLVRVIAEFLDHSGLTSGTQIGFSRTVTGSRVVRAIIHPNIDNYHLAHHLLPNIPHYNLKTAHRTLLTLSTYSKAHHCDGYVLGEYTALKSWMGKAKPA